MGGQPAAAVTTHGVEVTRMLGMRREERGSDAYLKEVPLRVQTWIIRTVGTELVTEFPHELLPAQHIDLSHQAGTKKYYEGIEF